MKPMAWLGIILIVVGVLAFSYQGVVWIRGEEKVAEVGPVEVTREKDFPVPLAPIIGGLCLAGGIFMLVSGRKESAA